MVKDIGRYTIHLNPYHLDNFAFGFDFYILYMYPISVKRASVFMLSFIFFNITITRWHTRDYIAGA